jgi:hypothetical protein
MNGTLGNSSFTTGTGPRSVCFDGTRIWVANNTSNTVTSHPVATPINSNMLDANVARRDVSNTFALGQTVTAGGVNVTAGGVNVTAGGVNVTAGGVNFGSATDVKLDRTAANKVGLMGLSGGAAAVSTAYAMVLDASGTVSGNAVAAVATTTHTRTNNVATMTTAAHNLVAGQRVTISGCTTATYNLTDVKVVAVPSTTTFTYVCVGADDAGTADATGTVTALAEVQLGSNVRVPTPVQAAGGTAGTDLYIYGSNAVNGTTPSTVTNNASGSIILQAGTPTGTGARGTVQAPGAGTDSTAIGPRTIASGGFTTVIGGYATATGAATSGIVLGQGSGATYITLDTPAGFRMAATPLVANYVESSAQVYGSSAEAILVTDQVDVTQTAYDMNAHATALVVTGTTATVTTPTAHKFSINQQVTISGATKWVAVFGAGINTTFTVLTVPSTTSFTFTYGTAGVSTNEDTAGALMTPGDILLSLSANTSFYPSECFVWVSTAGSVMTVQPTIRFGKTAGGADYLAAVITTGLTAIRGRQKYTTFVTDSGSNTLSAGITVPATVTGTWKVRFGFKGVYVRD